MHDLLAKGISQVRDLLSGGLPGGHRDERPSRTEVYAGAWPLPEEKSPVGERPAVRLVYDQKRDSMPVLETDFGRWATTPAMRQMLERYPEGKLPIEEAREVLKGVSPERLNAVPRTDDAIRHLAFVALRRVEDQLVEQMVQVSPADKAELIRCEATSLLIMEDAVGALLRSRRASGPSES